MDKIKKILGSSKYNIKEKKEIIYKIYKSKIDEILNNNSITNLEKNILLTEYKKIYDNIIYCNNTSSIIPMHKPDKSYFVVNSYSLSLTSNGEETFVKETKKTNNNGKMEEKTFRTKYDSSDSVVIKK